MSIFHWYDVLVPLIACTMMLLTRENPEGMGGYNRVSKYGNARVRGHYRQEANQKNKPHLCFSLMLARSENQCPIVKQ